MFSMIIIDYNSMMETIDYINQFSNKCNNFQYCHVIVIDNYSKQNDFPKIYSQYGKIKYVTEIDKRKVYSINHNGIVVYYCSFGENAGFARGNNLGVRISKELFNDDYYLFSNNDIILKNTFDIKRFELIFESHPEVSIIGPRVTSPDGIEQSPCKKISVFKQLFANYWGYAIPFVKVTSDLDFDGQSKICYWVSGCFFLSKADVFEKVGGFDEATFLYAEEMILSERMLRKSYYSYFDSNYHIIHLGGSTTKKTSSNLKIMEMRFKSLCYYQKIYRGVNDRILKLAAINFSLYSIVAKIKDKLR